MSVINAIRANLFNSSRAHYILAMDKVICSDKASAAKQLDVAIRVLSVKQCTVLADWLVAPSFKKALALEVQFEKYTALLTRLVNIRAAPEGYGYEPITNKFIQGSKIFADEKFMRKLDNALRPIDELE